MYIDINIDDLLIRRFIENPTAYTVMEIMHTKDLMWGKMLLPLISVVESVRSTQQNRLKTFAD